MNGTQIIGFLLLPLGLALACGGDEDPEGPPGQGGSSSAGAAGTNPTSAGSGSGGSRSGSSGTTGNNQGGSSGTGNVSGAGGMPGGNGSGNGTVGDVCERGCVKTESLNCPNDPADCEAACLADYLDFPAECRALVLTLGDCAADRPVSDFGCDEDGEAHLRPGPCGSESIAVANCVLETL